MSYQSMQLSAWRQIKRKGAVYTLTRVAPVTVDEATDTASAGATQTLSIVAVVSPVQPPKDATFEVATDVKRNQRRLMIAALDVNGNPLSFEPDANQRIAFEGSVWTLGGTSVERPDGVTPIYYDVLAQR